MKNYNLSSYDVFRSLNSILILAIDAKTHSAFRPYLESRCWTLAFYGLPDMHCSQFTDDLI